MQYLIHQERMDELLAMITQHGQPATQAAKAAMDAGDGAAANKALEADAKAWEMTKEWHRKRINEDQYGGNGDTGGGHTGDGIPSNAIQMFRDPDGHLKTKEGGDVAIFGKNYAAYVTAGPGSSAPWQYFVGEMDGNTASMSCDGRKIAWTVADSPTDPGEPYYANTAYVQPYKKGQYCCFRIGEGGNSAETVAIFSVN